MVGGMLTDGPRVGAGLGWAQLRPLAPLLALSDACMYCSMWCARRRAACAGRAGPGGEPR
jgi:hypothetical protein